MRKIEIIVLLAIAGLVVVANLGLKDWVNGKNESLIKGSVSAQDVVEGKGDSFFAVASEVIEVIVKKPDTVNVLLIGFDKSKALADINIVAHINTASNSVKLISIPRDLFIDFRQTPFSEIKANNSDLSINYCKLTEVYYYAGKGERALDDMKAIASGVTGLDISYVAAVNTNGFNDIIDIVGGVDFYVPQDMYYSDPYQDLLINLKEGQQLLNGDKAEQLVRFRKYGGDTPPDKQRMKVQHDFLRALSSQMLSIKSLSTIKELMTKAYEMIETDASLLTMIDYAEYILGQDLSELLAAEDMIIVPSSGERMGELNLWYEAWNEEEVKAVVNALIDKD